MEERIGSSSKWARVSLAVPDLVWMVRLRRSEGMSDDDVGRWFWNHLRGSGYDDEDIWQK
jgi:hypothetical protein